MDELIEDLRKSLIQVKNIDAIKLAALASSYKDLCIARFVEEVRDGRLQITPWGEGYKLRKSL